MFVVFHAGSAFRGCWFVLRSSSACIICLCVLMLLGPVGTLGVYGLLALLFVGCLFVCTSTTPMIITITITWGNYSAAGAAE